jgi:hypothetical protein
LWQQRQVSLSPSFLFSTSNTLLQLSIFASSLASLSHPAEGDGYIFLIWTCRASSSTMASGMHRRLHHPLKSFSVDWPARLAPTASSRTNVQQVFIFKNVSHRITDRGTTIAITKILVSDPSSQIWCPCLLPFHTRLPADSDVDTAPASAAEISPPSTSFDSKPLLSSLVDRNLTESL